jgi:hypothetical protein
MSTNTPKRGRPFKSDDERRDAPRLVIKLNAAERAALEAAGDGDLSVWARETLLRAARRRAAQAPSGATAAGK